MARWSEDVVNAICPRDSVESFGTYAMDLSQGMDAVEAGMRSNFRRSLKEARRLSQRSLSPLVLMVLDLSSHRVMDIRAEVFPLIESTSMRS